MSWVKRNSILRLFAALFLVGSVFLSVLSPLSAYAAKSATTGEIKGGKFYVDVEFDGKKSKVEINNENSDITITPNSGQSSISDDGKVLISNVAPGTYTVKINFKITKEACEGSILKWFVGGAAYCSIKDPVNIVAEKIFTQVVVKADTTTFLEGTNDTESRLLAAGRLVNADGTARIDCDGHKDMLVRWVICPTIEMMFDALDFAITNIIQPYLTINPLYVNEVGSNKPSAVYAVWNNIRNIANIMFILAFFAVIFSQATSVGISNYGIKKLLPKLVIVAIATNLSFFVCALAVDVTNVLGAGIASLLTSTVLEGNATIDLTGLSFMTIPAIGLFAVALIPAFFVFMLIAFFIFVVAAICILLRQIFIILLVIISPLAFVAWLLPNTESYFRKWGTTFMKLLIMYPMIMLLFATGKIASTILGDVGDVGGGTGAGNFSGMLSFFALALPLIAVPFTFKASGGALGKAYGGMMNMGKRAGRQATDLGKKGFERSRYGQALKDYQHIRQLRGKAKGQEYAHKLTSGRGLIGAAARKYAYGLDEKGGLKYMRQGMIQNTEERANVYSEGLKNNVRAPDLKDYINTWAKNGRNDSAAAIRNDPRLVGVQQALQSGGINFKGEEAGMQALAVARTMASYGDLSQEAASALTEVYNSPETKVGNPAMERERLSHWMGQMDAMQAQNANEGNPAIRKNRVAITEVGGIPQAQYVAGYQEKELTLDKITTDTYKKVNSDGAIRSMNLAYEFANTDKVDPASGQVIKPAPKLATKPVTIQTRTAEGQDITYQYEAFVDPHLEQLAKAWHNSEAGNVTDGFKEVGVKEKLERALPPDLKAKIKQMSDERTKQGMHP